MRRRRRIIIGEKLGMERIDDLSRCIVKKEWRYRSVIRIKGKSTSFGHIPKKRKSD